MANDYLTIATNTGARFGVSNGVIHITQIALRSLRSGYADQLGSMDDVIAAYGN
jgi:hypothetical protein